MIVVLDKWTTKTAVEEYGSRQVCVRTYHANGPLRQKAVSIDVVAERRFLRKVGLSNEPPV